MNIALVLAGGTGTRVGLDIPKQYIEVNGKMIIEYCLDTLSRSELIDGIWIVADAMWQNSINKPDKFIGYSLPGTGRQLSIYNGIRDIQHYIDMYVNIEGDTYYKRTRLDTVLIHDAARPMLSEDTIRLCMDAVYKNGYDGAMPVLPMKDTVYISDDGKSIASLIDRNSLYAGQAPELFILDKYIEANEALYPDRIENINGSTEPAVMAGMNIAMVPGNERNYKITTKEDLMRFQNAMDT